MIEEPETEELPLGVEYTPLKHLVQKPKQNVYAVIKTIEG